MVAFQVDDSLVILQCFEEEEEVDSFLAASRVVARKEKKGHLYCTPIQLALRVTCYYYFGFLPAAAAVVVVVVVEDLTNQEAMKVVFVESATREVESINLMVASCEADCLSEPVK